MIPTVITNSMIVKPRLRIARSPGHGDLERRRLGRGHRDAILADQYDLRRDRDRRPGRDYSETQVDQGAAPGDRGTLAAGELELHPARLRFDLRCVAGRREVAGLGADELQRRGVEPYLRADASERREIGRAHV